MCRAVSGPSRYVLLLAALTTLAALLAGCAQFPDAGQQPWRERPDLSAERAPQPQLPETGEPTPAPNSDGPSVPPPCVDPDPQVVATCLAPMSAVVTLPGGAAALVAERTTGRILRVAPEETPETVATVPVDAAGDGGLTSLALSPSYAEDQLLYAYATTPAATPSCGSRPGTCPRPCWAASRAGRRATAARSGSSPTAPCSWPRATAATGRRRPRPPRWPASSCASTRSGDRPRARRTRRRRGGQRPARARRRARGRGDRRQLGHRPGRPARRPAGRAARGRAGPERSRRPGLDVARATGSGRVRRAAGHARRRAPGLERDASSCAPHPRAGSSARRRRCWRAPTADHRHRRRLRRPDPVHHGQQGRRRPRHADRRPRRAHPSAVGRSQRGRRAARGACPRQEQALGRQRPRSSPGQGGGPGPGSV